MQCLLKYSEYTDNLIVTLKQLFILNKELELREFSLQSLFLT